MSTKFHRGDRVEILKTSSPYCGFVGTVANAWWSPQQGDAIVYDVKITSFFKTLWVRAKEDDLIEYSPARAARSNLLSVFNPL